MLLIGTFFGGVNPHLDKYKVLAVQTALRNSTLMDLFERDVPPMQFYRDRGVGHLVYDCKPTCAIMTFYDPSDRDRGIASVLVNPALGKVLEVRASDNLIIARTQKIADVRAFAAKYPNAEITVHPIAAYSLVLYEVQTSQRTLSLVVKTTPDGEYINLYVECEDESGTAVVTNNITEFIEKRNCWMTE